jgi:hypothetical protein
MFDDVSTTQFFCFLAICTIWIIAYIFVVYDLITLISRTARPASVWRHIFESAILIGTGYVWVSAGEYWSLENNIWPSVAPVTGALVLIAYLYSSYRKRVAVLWLEVMVQVSLLVGAIGIIGLTLMMRFSPLFFIAGIPPAILFINALFIDYRKSG